MKGRNKKGVKNMVEWFRLLFVKGLEFEFPPLPTSLFSIIPLPLNGGKRGRDGEVYLFILELLRAFKFKIFFNHGEGTLTYDTRGNLWGILKKKI